VWATATRTLTAIDEDATTLDLDATIRAAVGLVAADLDTQIGAIPTNAELSTALGTADDAVLAQVALVKAKTDLIPGTQDGLTFANFVVLAGSALLGKASGLETTTAIYRAADDAKDRITATVDADGNRTAVTLDPA
jgi:ribosomal protein L7Ae-like RNA K-turn-binding protein